MVAVVVVISGEPYPVAPIRTLSQWVSATTAVDDGEKCETEKREPQIFYGTRFVGQATSASSVSGASSCDRLYERMWSTARLAWAAALKMNRVSFFIPANHDFK